MAHDPNALLLVVTGAYESPEAYSELATVLRQYARVEQGIVLEIKAGPPSGPRPVVKLIGNWRVWAAAIAGTVATGFLTQFGKRGADFVWDRIENYFESAPSKSLLDIAKALSEASIKCGPKTPIVVGINLPDDYFGTVLVISDSAPASVVHSLARFAEKAEDISQVIESAIAEGRGPLGPANIEIEEGGGIVVHWLTQQLKSEEIRLLP